MKNLPGLKLVLIIFFLNYLNTNSVYATHIMGGNLGYVYLGETTPGSGIYRYKVILQTFINCDSTSFVDPPCDDPVNIAVYSHDASNPNADKTRILTLDIFTISSDTIKPDLPDSCTVGNDACIVGCVYEGTIDLPLSFNGYNLMYHRCCRNCAILNIDQGSDCVINGGNVGQTWYAFIPATLTNNSSPVFTDNPVPYICAGDTTSILNTASDPDGDKLIFSFVTPYHGAGGAYPPTYDWPIPDAPYKTGFDKDKPFGSGGYSYINASSGYSEYYPPNTGNFVVAVEIKEYRNNVLIGISRRDLQLLVINCPANPPPNLTGAQGQGEIDYTIEEGDDLCFPISFWDTGGDSLEMILTGEVFDINKVNPVATANQNVKGDSLVKTDFCWNTVCNQERALKYTFYAKVSDNGCPSKTTNVEYRIKIDEFKGAESITGKSTVCAFDKGVSYSAASFTIAKYGWVITGGTKVSGDSTNSIIVDWGTSGTGNVKLTTISKHKCTGTTVNLSVKIDTLPVAKAGFDVSFCSKDTVSLGATPITTYSYTWSPTTGLVGGNIGNPKLTLTNTGAIPDTNLYILTVIDTIKSCTSKDTVQAIVKPFPIPNAGADQSFCSGNTITLGADSTINYTYLWKPTNGLSDTVSSKPNLTLTNSDSIPDTFSYKVITTLNSCTASDSARIIVKPLPISDAGSDLTFCSNKSDTLGVNSKSGYTYLWSPTNGLSNSTFSNPVISLTNNGNKPETVTYTVTTTLNACVSEDSAKVTTLPLPVSIAGSDKRICPDETDTLGKDTVTRYKYSWSPSYGLNNTSLRNPLVKISVPDTSVTYVVTTTDSTTGCVSTDTVIVVIKPLPVSNAGPDTTLCSGDTISIGSNSQAGYTYLWNPLTGILDSLASRPLLTLTNLTQTPDTSFYTVETTLEGCKTFDTVRVEIKNLPISDAGSDVAFCTEDSVSIGVTSKSAHTYSWSPTKGLNSTTVSNPKISLTNNGNKPEIVTYTVTTTLRACVSKDSTKVTILPLPVSFAGSDKRICPDETDTLGKDTVTRYKFLWSPSYGLNNTSLRNPLVKISVPDTSVTYVVTTTDSTTGCVSTDTVKVVIKPLPVSNAGPDTTLCSGDTISIGSTSQVGYSYLWIPLTGILDSIASRPLLTLTNLTQTPDTSFYTVETTLEGCKTYDTVRVEIKNLPVADAGSDVAFCTGDTVSMGIASKPGYTYTWTPVKGLSDSTVSNPEISLIKIAFPPDTINYMLTNTLRLCKSIDTTRVVVFPNPNTKEVIGSVSLCPGVKDVNYWVERPPNSTFEWFLQGGGVITSGQGNDTIFTDWATPGPGKISVVETDSNTCVGDTFSIGLKVHYELEPPLPKGPDTLCDRYIDSVKYYNIYTNGSSYTWFIEDGLLLTIDSNRVYAKWNGVGFGKLWYEEVSITDTVCKGVSDTLFSVIYKSPVADSITGQFEVCEDSASIQFYINGLPGSDFTWLVDEDTVANGVDVDTVYITWDTAGLYQIKVIETTPNACTETLFDTVTVYKTPRTSLIKGDTVICFVNGDQFPYEVEGLDSSVFVWDIIGGTIMSANDSADSISIRWDSVGIHKITVTEVSKDSCIGASVLLNVVLNETPSANTIEGNFYMCEKNSNIQYKLNGLDSSTYYWSAIGAANLQDDSSNFIILDWDSAAYYLISVLEISNKGCVGDTVDSLVQINPLPQTSPITGDTTICFFPADSFPYAVNGFAKSYFHWEIIGGKILGADSVDTVIVRWDSVGLGQIKVIEESIDTCWGDTMKLNIILWKVPDADSILGNSYMCEKNTGIMYQISGLDSSSYFWNSTGGTNIIDDSSKTYSIDWDTAGYYELSVFEVSIKGCKDDTVKRKIKINPLPQTSSISGDSIICPSFEIFFPYTVFGLDSSTFIWTLSDGNIMAGDSSDSIMVKWDSSSQSTSISVFEISKDTCTNYSVNKNLVLDAPHIRLKNVSTQENDDAKIDINWFYVDKNQYPDNIMIFKRKRFDNGLWDLAYAISGNNESLTDNDVLSDKESYEYKVYGLNACRDTIKTVFHNTVLLNGEMNESNESVSLNWNRYNTWETGVDYYQLWRKLDDEDKFQFYKNLNLDTLIYLDNGDDAFVHCFRIIAVSSSGIESWSNEFCVEFQHLLNPPNAISPNGDEFNEYWTIDDIQRYPNAKVVIFNRWGNEVYHSIGYNNDFNGERNGEPLPDGTYYYIIEPNKGSEVYNGYLTIVR